MKARKTSKIDVYSRWCGQPCSCRGKGRLESTERLGRGEAAEHAGTARFMQLWGRTAEEWCAMQPNPDVEPRRVCMCTYSSFLFIDRYGLFPPLKRNRRTCVEGRDVFAFFEVVHQSQASSNGQCRQQGGQRATQGSDCHSRFFYCWKLRHRVGLFVLEELHVPLVHECVRLVLELGTEL